MTVDLMTKMVAEDTGRVRLSEIYKGDGWGLGFCRSVSWGSASSVDSLWELSKQQRQFVTAE